MNTPPEAQMDRTAIKYMHLGKLPVRENITADISSHPTGYNQEDGLVMNKSPNELSMFAVKSQIKHNNQEPVIENFTEGMLKFFAIEQQEDHIPGSWINLIPIYGDHINFQFNKSKNLNPE